MNRTVNEEIGREICDIEHFSLRGEPSVVTFRNVSLFKLYFFLLFLIFLGSGTPLIFFIFINKIKLTMVLTKKLLQHLFTAGLQNPSESKLAKEVSIFKLINKDKIGFCKKIIKFVSLF